MGNKVPCKSSTFPNLMVLKTQEMMGEAITFRGISGMQKFPWISFFSLHSTFSLSISLSPSLWLSLSLTLSPLQSVYAILLGLPHNVSATWVIESDDSVWCGGKEGHICSCIRRDFFSESAGGSVYRDSPGWPPCLFLGNEWDTVAASTEWSDWRRGNPIINRDLTIQPQAAVTDPHMTYVLSSWVVLSLTLSFPSFILSLFFLTWFIFWTVIQIHYCNIWDWKGEKKSVRERTPRDGMEFVNLYNLYCS